MAAKGGRGKASRDGGAGRQRLALAGFGAVFVLLFVGFAIAQGIGSPSVPSGDVAKVQDVPSELATISQSEFDHAMERQVAQAKLKKAPAPGSKKYEELKKAALGELLEGTWIRGEAEEMGIQVTQKQVEQKLKEIKQQSFPGKGAYQKFLKESKFTPEDVNRVVEVQILSEAIQEQVKSETPAPSSSEVKAYYEAEKATQFSEKESRDVRIVLNKDKAKVEAAKKQLEGDHSPAGWKKATKKYSSDPTSKAKGGLTEGITEEFLQEPLKEAIFGSATGELVGPTKFETNWILTEVVKLNPAKVKPLAEVKAQIEETLKSEKQQEFFSEFISGYQSKWISRSYCASGYEIEKCTNFTGSGHPANASPACYEANPKTPAKECPAPVTPISPALPGTITEQKPKGEPFQQRPIPESVAEEGAATEAPIPGATPEAETGE
ncbi:MAG TPA: SurA N-terminal domain-containing protein [Solirubrobacterales bacterium]|nr:SurA N-terminal domain-containing protein [Solirubrobacterales bacterium]